MPRVVVIVALLVGWAVPRAVRAAPISDDLINRAVARGVAALKSSQQADGSYGNRFYRSGPTSLAALALLECGVPADDEHVQKAVNVVRNACPDMNETYHLALAIMLLDRLNDPLDEPIIHVLTTRLLEGQQAIGAWSYSIPIVSDDGAKTVRTVLVRRAELKTNPGGPPTERALPTPEIRDRARLMQEQRPPTAPGTVADNSNTQFALLGLWVGRRHGIDTGTALARAEAYFRASHVNGRWPYRAGGEPGIVAEIVDGPANTCSGLIGLAIGTGLVRERQMRTRDEGKNDKVPKLRDPLKDPVVQAAMNFVGAQVASLVAKGYGDAMRDLYFLWSVERTGMIYSVPVMGGINWYQVGAGFLLRTQLADGSWGAGPTITHNDGPISTSFALLLLKRSNVARDLTTNLQKKLTQQTLKAGNEKGEPLEVELPLSEAQALAKELPTAAPGRQAEILQKFRDDKGAEFTDTLAKVIGELTGDVQKQARDALAERLARMTVATLRSKLKDANAEVRRAAALAAAIKADKQLTGDLVSALDDADRWVTRAAAVALRTLTGQDFGPSASATPDDRAKSIAAWKTWWKRHGGAGNTHP
jgi:hypothetical protein